MIVCRLFLTFKNRPFLQTRKHIYRLQNPVQSLKGLLLCANLLNLTITNCCEGSEDIIETNKLQTMEISKGECTHFNDEKPAANSRAAQNSSHIVVQGPVRSVD
jgi:hypothetical protein